MDLFIWIAVFIGALMVLTKSADIFTTNSEKLGKALGIPQFIIGISIVALGTSLPELSTSVLANINDHSSIVAADVVGSNIANILLVVGVTSMWVKKMTVEKNLIKLDLPILLAITALLIVTIYDGEFNGFEAIVMLLTYIVYIFYNFSEHRARMIEKLEDKIDKTIHHREVEPKVMAWILAGGIGVFLGAKFTVDAIIEIADILEIGVSMIAVSAVAIGTSLPELVVSIMAARKGNYEMVIGNVIGSNIFNSTLVMAAPVLFGTINVTTDVITVAIPFLIIATLLFVFSGIERKVYNYEGALYGILYLVFLGQLFSFI